MGVVPIILSDEWALPFEDILDWDEFSIRVAFSDMAKLPDIIAEHRGRACGMSARVFDVYHQYMANGTQIMGGIEATMRRSPPTLTEEPSALEAATAAAKELRPDVALLQAPHRRNPQERHDGFLKSQLIPNHASSEAPSSLKAR